MNRYRRGSPLEFAEATSPSSPQLYLDFATSDLSDPDSTRNRVNALSNAKRALHFRIDLLADALGFDDSPFKKKNNFPEKLEFCGKCGVVAPRILGKVNRVRNALEHEYYLPARDETENFVDVTELFLAATDYLFSSFPRLVLLTSSDEEYSQSTQESWVTIETVRLTVEANFQPGSGLVSLVLSEMTVEPDEFAKLLVAETERVKSAGKAGTVRPDAEARWFILEKYRQRSSLEVRASDGQHYCDWVALLVGRTEDQR